MTETLLMQQIKEDIETHDHKIYIEPSKGQLLKILAMTIQAKTILEIGALYGYSTLWLHQGVAPDGIIHTMEKDPKRFEKACLYLKDYKNIKVHQGNATKLLESFHETVDMIFIDADKNHYLYYLEWAKKNLRPGGLLVADDTLLFGAVLGKKCTKKIRPSTLTNMKEFNRALNENPFESVILPYHDGFSIAIKKQT